MRSLLLTSSYFFMRYVHAALDLSFHTDNDLTSFVTRPDIKAPRFDIEVLDAQLTEAGYWFVAPYVSLQLRNFPPNYYQPCQTGPAIYTESGDLVWSGACLVRNQNTCDFRAFEHDGTHFMSAILYQNDDDPQGHGIIMDNSYNIVKNLSVPARSFIFNMHELTIFPTTNHALYFLVRHEYVDVTDVAPGMPGGWIVNVGFAEQDFYTGHTLFEWWAYDHERNHVRLNESRVEPENLATPPPGGWNFFHGNSIDKNEDGDYLVSARYTDCIYKISGANGDIIWRLGGTSSSFHLDGFNFSRQHDARWLESSDADKEILSFLDNAADGNTNTSTTSSVLIIELDKRNMTARVLNQYWRPDGELSRLRGNTRVLPNGNIFTGWSDNSYLTEHTRDGDLVMSARFQSERHVTYRAYKSNFTANPTEAPILEAFVYGTTSATLTTVYYVSWNGATEVATWSFYRAGNSALIGSTAKIGFETVFQSHGCENTVYVEGVAADGSVLGRSLSHMVDQSSLHLGLRDVACKENSWNEPLNMSAAIEKDVAVPSLKTEL